jgi:hypothetical protein
MFKRIATIAKPMRALTNATTRRSLSTGLNFELTPEQKEFQEMARKVLFIVEI